MPPTRTLGLPLLFALLAAGPAPAADYPQVDALKAKGLNKSGLTFVTDAEKTTLARIKDVRATLADALAASDRATQIQGHAKQIADLEATRADLLEDLDDLNQRINEQGIQQLANSQNRGGMGGGMGGGGMGGGGMGGPGGGGGGGMNMAMNNNMAPPGMTSQLIAQRNMIKLAVNQIAVERQSLRDAQDPKSGADPKALNEDAKKQAEVAKAALEELRPLLDDVAKQYAAHAVDPSVKAAINQLDQVAKANFKLGPSDAYKSALKAVDQAERKLLNKKTVAVAKTTKKKARSRR